jgi:hypothetical protein
MKTPRHSLRLSEPPFYGIIIGAQAMPLRSIHLPVMFKELTNFRKEVLTFKVVAFLGTYHVLLGWSCYAKFIVVLHYVCLKLKMPDLAES